MELHLKVREAWNRGLTPEEAKTDLCRRHKDCTAEFVEKTWKWCKENAPNGGAGSFPLYMLYGDEPFRDHSDEWSDEYKIWKGIIGPGKQLRDIIAAGRG